MELLERAAAQFKQCEAWQEAGDAFLKAAEVTESKCKDGDAVALYTKCAQAYENVAVAEALEIYEIAVRIRLGQKNFPAAARIYRDMADLVGKQGKAVDALALWQKAVDCYEAENNKSNAAQCYLQMARLAVEIGEYKEAIATYEKLAGLQVESELGKWSSTDSFFRAALCRFVLDAKQGECKDTAAALARYVEQHPQFSLQREYKLMTDLSKAFNDDDLDKFTDVIFKYDQVTKLDNATAKMLLSIKTILKDGVADDIASLRLAADTEVEDANTATSAAASLADGGIDLS